MYQDYKTEMDRRAKRYYQKHKIINIITNIIITICTALLILAPLYLAMLVFTD